VTPVGAAHEGRRRNAVSRVRRRRTTRGWAHVAFWIGLLGAIRWVIAADVLTWPVFAALFVAIVVGPQLIEAYATGTPATDDSCEMLADDVECSPEADSWHASTKVELERLGFHGQLRVRQTLGVSYELDGLSLNEQPRLRHQPSEFSIAREFHSPSTGEVAVAFHTTRLVTTRHRAIQQSTAFVEFTTRFRDGGQLCTNNAPFENPEPDWPGSVTYWLPQLSALTDLYTAHRRLTHAAVGRQIEPVVLNAPLDWDRQARARNLSFAERSGLAVVKDGVRYPTWKGVIRALWVWTPWRESLERRRAAALIAALGIQPRPGHSPGAAIR
jgi:hypothetical protein